MFGGDQNHVWDLLRKGKFGPESRVWDVLKKASLVRIFLRIWTKLAFSNNLKMDQTCLLARDQKFRREIKWTKLAFSKQVPHVILNSFKHFSGPKYKTLGTLMVIFNHNLTINGYFQLWFSPVKYGLSKISQFCEVFLVFKFVSW